MHPFSFRSTFSKPESKPRPPGRRLSPPQLFVLSFLLLVTIGTTGLMWLPGLYTGPGLSWLDALFTATSAVCVTGLVVVDTATYFTRSGQLFILMLIQMGGLGIITFTSLIILALGRRLSLRSSELTLDSTSFAPHVQPAHLLRDVVLFTFSIELLGAIGLFLAWGPEIGWQQAIWPAIFHSVSAFCNAGFSTFSSNLMGFQDRPIVLVIISALIVLGGIGFLTLEELRMWLLVRHRKTRFRFSVHSRLVLITTAILIIVSWSAFSFLEWNNRLTIGSLDPVEKLANTLLQSTTARTAGFNSIDYSHASVSSNFLSILMMAIGGSPGSTAGGIKTTTLALIILLAWSRLRGQSLATFAGRSIPEETIQRAVGLFVAAFTVMTVALLIVTLAEIKPPQPQDYIASDNPDHSAQPHVAAPQSSSPSFLACMFEVTSAFNTVGLSMNLTTTLGALSRSVLTFLMFLGRVGPLIFTAALALPRQHGLRRFRYAYEDVIVG